MALPTVKIIYKYAVPETGYFYLIIACNKKLQCLTLFNYSTSHLIAQKVSNYSNLLIKNANAEGNLMIATTSISVKHVRNVIQPVKALRHEVIESFYW